MSTLTVDLDKARLVGQNIRTTTQDNLLVLVIDTNLEVGLSQSGKMVEIASANWDELGYGVIGKIYIGRSTKERKGNER